jgi:hypothetical protein
MATIAEPSVKSLLLQMRFQGRPLATGTGIVAEAPSGPVLVTTWHNVTGRNSQTKELLSSTGAVPDEIVIVHNRSGKLCEWVLRTERLVVDGKSRWVEHPQHGDKLDVVALPLQHLDDVQLYPYAGLGEADPKIFCGPADTVSVVGFPFGLQAGGSLAIWATGFVASEPDIDFENRPCFLIDCRTRPGQSGSAVIAHRNGGMVAMDDGSSVAISGPMTRFLGVYSGRVNAQSDIGLVWKAAAVREVVATA